MRPDPFGQMGTWLRCALHAHTTNSDGELAPSELVRHYEEAGFDALAITDHWVRTVEPSTDSLLVLAGTELDALRGDRRTSAHVLALGIENDPEPRASDFPGLEETVAWARAAGGVPYIAHTYWSGLRSDEFERCEGLAGLEVFNAGCELEVGRGHAALHWDETLEAGGRLFGIATDDSHHPGRDSGHAWVWACCEERTPEAVLAALDSGAFYSSAGPEIQALETDDGDVLVRCSPARSLTLVSGRTKGARVNAGEGAYIYSGEVLATDGDGLIVEARLTRPQGASHGRLEVEDDAGRRAWTNPLWP
ncbi:MAG TPA: CehA/McbA family metallohydrolase [Gaiellaceae bacterium]|nr:CehA/McbA family metallohydrolase [Gaiellaceae bacterium]